MHQGSISSTFYKQLLSAKILKAQKDSQAVILFYTFGTYFRLNVFEIDPSSCVYRGWENLPHTSVTNILTAFVCGMSVMIPSVMMSKMKYCDPSRKFLAMSATCWIAGAKLVGPYNWTFGKQLR